MSVSEAGKRRHKRHDSCDLRIKPHRQAEIRYPLLLNLFRRVARFHLDPIHHASDSVKAIAEIDLEAKDAQCKVKTISDVK